MGIYEGFMMGATLDRNKVDKEQLKIQQEQAELYKDEMSINRAIKIIKEPFTPDTIRMQLYNNVIVPRVSKISGDTLDMQPITEWNDDYTKLANQLDAIESNKSLPKKTKNILRMGRMSEFFGNYQAADALFSREQEEKTAEDIIRIRDILSRSQAQEQIRPEDVEYLATLKKQDNFPSLISKATDELEMIKRENPRAYLMATNKGDVSNSGGGIPREIQISEYRKKLSNEDRVVFDEMFKKSEKRGVDPEGDSSYKKAFQDKLGKEHAKELSKYYQDATNASGEMGIYEELRNLFSQTDTGALEPHKTAIAAYAQALGIPASDKLGVNQAIEAISNKLTIMARNMGGAGQILAGSISDSDREFLKNSVPSLDKSIDANQLLLNIMQRATKRRIEIAELADEYLKENDTMRGFNKYKNQWIKDNSMFNDMPTIKRQGEDEIPNASQEKQITAEEFLKRFK